MQGVDERARVTQSACFFRGLTDLFVPPFRERMNRSNDACVMKMGCTGNSKADLDHDTGVTEVLIHTHLLLSLAVSFHSPLESLIERTRDTSHQAKQDKYVCERR